MSDEYNNVHHIMTTTQSLSRLLERRDKNGNLILADREVVKLAINAAMEESSSLRDLLSSILKYNSDNVDEFKFLSQNFQNWKKYLNILKTN